MPVSARGWPFSRQRRRRSRTSWRLTCSPPCWRRAPCCRACWSAGRAPSSQSPRWLATSPWTPSTPPPSAAWSAQGPSRPTRLRGALPGPLDWPDSLAFLSMWGDDLLDRWDGAHLVRTVNSSGRAIPFVGVPAGTVAEPALDVTIEHAADRPSVEAAVRRMFVFPPPEFGELLAHDPLLAALDAPHPGLRAVRQLG